VAYPTKQGAIPAIQNITYSIEAGSFIGLVGPSGCGKTTLLRVVGGLISTYEGTMTVGGVTPDEARRKRKVSFMFQRPVLLPWKTVQQNVELPLRLSGYSRQHRKDIADHFLDIVGLNHVANGYPHQLSGGMQQRVALARALCFEPEILLLDEPFSALDEMNRERLNIELLRIWETTRVTVMFVTHALSEAVFLADRVLVMSDHPGRLIAEVMISLPRPRSADILEQPVFLHFVTQVRHALRSAQPETREEKPF
jgi:NitT/TauT family transport system ATP-binding protein